MKCLLCHNDSVIFQTEYFQCSNCFLVFKNPRYFPNKNQELDRYKFHNNDCQEVEYLKYLQQLIDPIKTEIKNHFLHLDFGCGVDSGFKILLEKKVASSALFDVYFHNDEKKLNQTFDLITASEVVEHFQGPKEEWDKLNDLLKPGGFLAVMTMFYNDQIDFKSWWYKNDITHVVFYHQKTLEFIAQKLKLSIVYNDQKKIVIFKKEIR